MDEVEIKLLTSSSDLKGKSNLPSDAISSGEFSACVVEIDHLRASPAKLGRIVQDTFSRLGLHEAPVLAGLVDLLGAGTFASLENTLAGRDWPTARARIGRDGDQLLVCSPALLSDAFLLLSDVWCPIMGMAFIGLGTASPTTIQNCARKSTLKCGSAVLTECILRLVGHSLEFVVLTDYQRSVFFVCESEGRGLTIRKTVAAILRESGFKVGD